MNFVIIAFIIFLIFWFLGVGAVAFHVIKYASPGDRLLPSFFVFFISAAISFFWVLSYVMGAL